MEYLTVSILKRVLKMMPSLIVDNFGHSHEWSEN